MKIGKDVACPEPRKFYDIIIVGGSGHGLGTAYYLAKEHGLKNIAVMKGWLGSGNTGRNTTIIDQTISGMKVLIFMSIL